MVIDLVQGFRSATRGGKCKNMPAGRLFVYSDEAKNLIVSVPSSRALRVLARFAAFALLFLPFLWLGSFRGGSAIVSSRFNDGVSNYAENLKLLPLLLHDLTNEGLLKIGEKTLFVRSSQSDEDLRRSQKMSYNLVHYIAIDDVEQQREIPSEALDFIFTHNFPAAMEFIDRALKVGGIVAFEISDDENSNPAQTSPRPTNYKLVYLKRFGSTVMAMRKTGQAETKSVTRNRRLCGFAGVANKEALNNLEDVLLEPPRASSGKSRRYFKRTRYLPDLIGDSLESYPRRVFIDVGFPEKETESATGWFEKNYPMRNKNFEMYEIETVPEESSSAAAKRKEVPQMGMSEWLRKNVKEEEYVVVKAEADVVDEMVKSKAIRLVDELFLDCKSQGRRVGPVGSNRGRRPYWECLALYGRLRDEGVAVHQWWI